MKKLFSRKKKFSDEEYERHYEAKKEALEKILGEMHEMVGHALIPFQIGGAVDLYYFPRAIDGTALVTMELIEPDGTGPKPNRNGTYELIAFTRHKITGNDKSEEFKKIENRIWRVLTTVARYSFAAKLEPGETAEVPGDEDETGLCLVFDDYGKEGVDFAIDGRKHGLLLCIEVFKSEMEHAMQHGSRSLFEKLKERGHYPYSDLDREPVA